MVSKLTHNYLAQIITVSVKLYLKQLYLSVSIVW